MIDYSWKNRPKTLTGHIYSGFTRDKVNSGSRQVKLISIERKCWCGEIHGKTDREIAV